MRGLDQQCSSISSFGTPEYSDRYSQPCANIDITTGNLGGSEENVSTVATGADNFHGVAATVCFGCVERDCASLVAVRSISGPSRLVPATFKVVRDLGECRREQRESRKA